MACGLSRLLVSGQWSVDECLWMMVRTSSAHDIGDWSYYIARDSLCVAGRLELLESDPMLMWLSVSFSWSYAELMPRVPTVCWQLVRHCPRVARRKNAMVN